MSFFLLDKPIFGSALYMIDQVQHVQTDFLLCRVLQTGTLSWRTHCWTVQPDRSSRSATLATQRQAPSHSRQCLLQQLCLAYALTQSNDVVHDTYVYSHKLCTSVCLLWLRSVAFLQASAHATKLHVTNVGTMTLSVPPTCPLFGVGFTWCLYHTDAHLDIPDTLCAMLAAA